MKIFVSDFVKRQTRYSEFSYYNGSWDGFEKMINVEVFNNGVDGSNIKAGYRDEVKLIDVSGQAGFYSSVVPMSDDIKYEMVYEARREGEEPVSKRKAYGRKEVAPYVEIVIYHRLALQEDDDYVIRKEVLDGDYWEVVSINCRLTKEEYPIPPMTMSRNQLANTEGGKGGTKANYTGDQFAESIRFWNNHIMITEEL